MEIFWTCPGKFVENPKGRTLETISVCQILARRLALTLNDVWVLQGKRHAWKALTGNSVESHWTLFDRGTSNSGNPSDWSYLFLKVSSYRGVVTARYSFDGWIYFYSQLCPFIESWHVRVHCYSSWRSSRLRLCTVCNAVTVNVSLSSSHDIRDEGNVYIGRTTCVF